MRHAVWDSIFVRLAQPVNPANRPRNHMMVLFRKSGLFINTDELVLNVMCVTRQRNSMWPALEQLE